MWKCDCGGVNEILDKCVCGKHEDAPFDNTLQPIEALSSLQELGATLDELVELQKEVPTMR